MRNSEQSGFTIIELLVVISIMSLLASVILVTSKTARIKARDTKRKADIAQLQKALELYYSQNVSYPVSGGATQPNAFWSNSSDSSWTTLQNLMAPYVAKLPKDPSENNNPNEWAFNGLHYSYYSGDYGCGAQQFYIINYQLEVASGQDPGITGCNGTNFQYGGGGANTAIKTIGAKAK